MQRFVAGADRTVEQDQRVGVVDGPVPGTHTLLVDGTVEQLQLTHEARDRLVFAEGALTAAAWLAEKWKEGKRGVFSMDDLLDDALARSSPGGA
jgi:4-hydroxy-tetrahydrodipicolinate reductase